jgi:hypothetical protein
MFHRNMSPIHDLIMHDRVDIRFSHKLVHVVEHDKLVALPRASRHQCKLSSLSDRKSAHTQRSP